MSCGLDKVDEARLLQIVLCRIVLCACSLMMITVGTETYTDLQCPNALELYKHKNRAFIG